MFLNGWTKEKVLEQIKKKNLGYPAKNDDGSCFYRQDVNGQTNCCLVGAFIPDDLYHEGMEFQGIDDILDKTLEKHMPMDVDSMAELQGYHDGDLERDMDYTGASLYDLVEKFIDNKLNA